MPCSACLRRLLAHSPRIYALSLVDGGPAEWLDTLTQALWLPRYRIRPQYQQPAPTTASERAHRRALWDASLLRIILAASNVSKAYIHLTGYSNTCLCSDLWVLYGLLWRAFCSCDVSLLCYCEDGELYFILPKTCIPLVWHSKPSCFTDAIKLLPY